MNASEDDFFIGYRDGMSTRVRRTSASLAAQFVMWMGFIGFVVAFDQPTFPPATFEFLEPKTFEGVITATPFPRLLVDRPNSDSRSSYLLVSTGKFGAQDVAREHDGRRVRLDGTLVSNGAATMLELVDGSIEVLGDATGAPPAEEILGTRELVGEIVDSKCWLGVMQPGRLKTHRSCAIRCIAGGIPPLFVVTAYGDAVEALVLVGADGRAINAEILDLVGDNLTVIGEVSRSGDLLVLSAEPDDFTPVVN